MISRTKAYVPQSPWILTGNIRENITFGKEYNNVKYEKTIEACALKKDFELFSCGDLTEIGERGINMSGGQKQRIQIARAVYQDADIYLLDDPFSAVDAHTGTHLFKECLMGILKEKTILFVTHQVMQNGKIAQAGKFEELLEQNIGFEVLVGAHSKALESIVMVENSSRTTLDPIAERESIFLLMLLTHPSSCSALAACVTLMDGGLVLFFNFYEDMHRKQFLLLHVAMEVMLLLLSALVSPLSDEGQALMRMKASFSNVLHVLLDWDDLHNDDFCSWHGVYCDNVNLTVLSLNLSSLNLGGEISPAIGDLRNLQSIDLQGNKLTGQIPDEIGNCAALIHLDLSDNQLYGGIPFSISKLKQLVFFDLARNRLTGEIPRLLYWN